MRFIEKSLVWEYDAYDVMLFMAKGSMIYLVKYTDLDHQFSIANCDKLKMDEIREICKSANFLGYFLDDSTAFPNVPQGKMVEVTKL